MKLAHDISSEIAIKGRRNSLQTIIWNYDLSKSDKLRICHLATVWGWPALNIKNVEFDIDINSHLKWTFSNIYWHLRTRHPLTMLVAMSIWWMKGGVQIK